MGRNKKGGFVYLIKNHSNTKVYVGITTSTLYRRWTSHKHRALKEESPYKLYAAMRKYGFESFWIEAHKVCETWEELVSAEIQAIAQFDSFINGYNMTQGGEGHLGISTHHSETTRNKISKANKGHKTSAETRSRIGQANRGFKHSETTKERMSQTRTGLKHSAETRQKMSDSNKARWARRKAQN